MKNKLCALLLAVAGLGAGHTPFSPPIAHAEDDVSFSFFYDSLEPFGEWLEVGDYGLCWRPTAVSAEWAPYTDGYWSYTDGGWTWVSYEDFGGIVYHYGRWVRVEETGWCWVPEYEWGPAWVSWRHTEVEDSDEDYVGWAPLPPEARWEPEVGFSVQVDSAADIGPGNYNFCRTRDFGAPVIREVIIPRPRNVVIIDRTVNITNITVNHFYGDRGIPFCGGPRFDYISRHVLRPIPTLKLVQETNITNINNITNVNINNGNRGGNRRGSVFAVQRGNQLIVAAPRVRRGDNPLTAFPNLRPKRVIAANAVKVSRGWDEVKAPEARQQLRDKFARQSREAGADRTPAKPLERVSLQAVPEKGDPNAPSPVATGRGKLPREGRGNPAAVPGANAAERDGDRDRNGRGRGNNDPRTVEDRPAAPVATGEDARERNPGAGRDPRGNAATAGAGKGKGRQGNKGRDAAEAGDGAAVPAPVDADGTAAADAPARNGAAEGALSKRAQRDAAEAARTRAAASARETAQAERAARQTEQRAAEAARRTEREGQEQPGADAVRGDREDRMGRGRGEQSAREPGAGRERQAPDAGERPGRERAAAAQENAAQQHNAERAARAQREAGEARREQAGEAAQAQRQQQAARAASAERQRDNAGAAEARQQQQAAAQRAQAGRQQAMENQRAAQAERGQQQQRVEGQQRARAEAQQRQAQMQQQQQQNQQNQAAAQRGNGGGGGGNQQRGRGKRELTAEEAAAQKKNR